MNRYAHFPVPVQSLRKTFFLLNIAGIHVIWHAVGVQTLWNISCSTMWTAYLTPSITKSNGSRDSMSCHSHILYFMLLMHWKHVVLDLKWQQWPYRKLLRVEPQAPGSCIKQKNLPWCLEPATNDKQTEKFFKEVPILNLSKLVMQYRAYIVGEMVSKPLHI